jgi:hypothetical protein
VELNVRQVTLTAVLAAWAIPVSAQNIADISTSYDWKPVSIGAGGWVVGFATHPTNASVRYARTDVGNAYKWNGAAGRWVPLKVVQPDGAGFPGSLFTAPGPGGIQSIAVDPNDPNGVYIAATNNRSADIGGGTGINIYRSTDGGNTFKAGNLNISGDPNDAYRMRGERLRVDPKNSHVVYFGSGFAPGTTKGSGLFRSVDNGARWSAVSSPLLAAPQNVINVVIDPLEGLTSQTPFGSTVGKVSRHVWACAGHEVSGSFVSDLFESEDGGVSWVNRTAGTALGGSVAEISLDTFGNLFVIQTGTKKLWEYANSKWSTFEVGVGDILNAVAVDPKNPRRIFVIAQDASVARSLDGGQTWTNFGRLQYSNVFSWLPQVPGNAQAYGYRSTGGIFFDCDGALWVCQGNEGMLTYLPSSKNSESASKPPKWQISSIGIEELVAQDIIVPKGGNDQIYTAVEDATGMLVSNPDNFTAQQIPLQTNLISQGTQVSACPNDPKTIVVTTSNVYSNGANQSGISFDGGKTWSMFASCLKLKNSGGTFDVQAGSIAISCRGNWKAGHDHIVVLPVYNCVPEYSQDGGKTWAATKTFPTNPDGLTFQDNSDYQGFWSFALKQRELYADPLVADRFFLKLTRSPGLLYVSNDGGETWAPSDNCGLPNFTHHGQLGVNYARKGDLWFADGWEGASEHGLYHSTNSGTSFTKISGVTNAISLALGAGSGKAGDQPYTVYFYGKFASDPRWGLFRSTNGGTSWQRVAYYPTGLVDQPTCMAASWDTFGKVYVGFSGDSYVYGSLR